LTGAATREVPPHPINDPTIRTSAPTAAPLAPAGPDVRARRRAGSHAFDPERDLRSV